MEQQIREEIITALDYNMFVEAGAGAGKTTLIVNRIVNQLKANIEPERIVVITFTNAAAEELRERIIKKTRQEGIHANIEGMNISTIHSFCNKLLKEQAFALELPLDFELLVKEENKNVQIMLFEQWLSTLDASKWKDMNPTDEKRNKVAKDVLNIYLNIANLHENVDIVCDIAKRTHEECSKDIEDILKKVDEKLCEVASTFIGVTYNEIKDIDQSYLNKPAQAYINHREKGELDNAAKAIAKKDKNYLKRDKQGIEEDFTIFIDSIKEQLIALNEEYSSIKYKKYIQYAKLARQYYLNERGRKELNNDALLWETKCLLEKDEARRYFADKFSCIYVDEFQDTDSVQWDFIRLLSLDKDNKNKLRDGALFVVGDPKQSIYRFRGAQPEVYIEAKEYMKQESNKAEVLVKIYELHNNYRSNEKIIEWVNESFDGGIFDSKMTAINTLPQNLTGVLAGVYSYEGWNSMCKREEDMKQVVELIHNLVDKQKLVCDGCERLVKYSDILILCRNTTHMDEYLSELKRNEIPVQVMGKSIVSKDILVRRFVRLYAYMANYKDATARMGAVEVLRYLGYSEEACNLAELHEEIKEMTPYGMAIFLSKKLEFFIKGKMDKVDVVTSLSKLQQMIENVAFKCQGNACEFAEHLREYSENDVEKELIINPCMDAVRIMNVHKAKGLEGNIVVWAGRTESTDFNEGSYRCGDKYYPSVDMGFSHYWCSYKTNQVLFEQAAKEEKDENKRLEYVAATRAKQVLIFMNAVKTGCMFYDFGQKSATDNLKGIVNIAVGETNTSTTNNTYTKYKSVEHRLSAKTKEYVYESISPSDKEVKSGIPKAETPFVNKERPKGNVIGTALHRIMELIILRDFQRSWLEKSVDQAMSESELTEGREFMVDAAGAFLDWIENNQIVEKILLMEPELKFAYYEKETNTFVNGTMDCVVKTADDSYMVIDFKSDNDAYYEAETFDEVLRERYIGQMNMYREAVSKLKNVPESNVAVKIMSFTYRYGDKMQIRITDI